MNATRSCLFLGLLVLLFSGCGQSSGPKQEASLFRLFDLFQPEDLTGQVTPESAGWPRTEWLAPMMAPWTPPAKSEADGARPAPSAAPALGFRGVSDLGGLGIDLDQGQGRLRGRATGPAPVLQFALKHNRGGADTVKWIEVRMTVSGAKQVWLRTEGSASFDEAVVGKWAAQTEEWKGAQDAEEGKVKTYRFEVSAARGDLRHFFLAFREAAGASFAIESVRLVSEREEGLKEPSGQQWAGLGEIYQAALAAKTPEIIRIPVRELPEGASLRLSIGTKENAPVKFTVTVSDREEQQTFAPATLFERTVTIPNRWQSARVDLSDYAGKSVLVEFALAGESKGLWGYWGAPTIRSRATESGRQGTAGKPRGVIFLVTDTLRKDHLNIYGYHRETLAHLKKFAEEGVAFNHAISQGTMTKISVPSMVTSLYPMTHTVLGFEKGLPASAVTLAEVFREEGYSTVAYSSVPFTGKSNNMHQGYDELHESSSISDPDYRSKTARHFVDRVIPWIEEHRDAPFFVFLHVFDPHSPFRPRPPYDTMWGAAGSRERLTEIEADMKKHNVQTSRDNLPHKEDYLKTGNDPEELLRIYKDWYDGSIRGMDAEIGRLMEALREMGLDRDTLMVWGADHGEEFWEHGKFFHGHTVYGELNQVPLVFRWPNSPEVGKGARVGEQVENIDIMPTILELAGIAGPTNMQGRSLTPLLRGNGGGNWPERPAITQAMVSSPGGASGETAKPHFGIIHQGWKLVRKETEPEAKQELYEHPIDSLNLTNVVEADGKAPRVSALAETLEGWKTRARSAELPSDETMAKELSSEELRRLRALGYVGGGTPAKPAAATNVSPSPANPGVNTNVATNAVSPAKVNGVQEGAGAEKKEGNP